MHQSDFPLRPEGPHEQLAVSSGLVVQTIRGAGPVLGLTISLIAAPFKIMTELRRIIEPRWQAADKGSE